MTDTSSSKLTALQAEALRGFFQREHGFFLTGGAALAGFYLHHRTTDDLDLFTTDAAAFERGRHVIRDLAQAIGGSVVIRQDTPRFVRLVLARGEEATVIDLVHDQAQHNPVKVENAGIRIDPPDEILINKLATLVSRAEERDLVDVMFLERSGLRMEIALDGALAKDGGCTPATLAWVLSEIVIPDGAVLPAGVRPEELRAYVADLIVRLRRAAQPSTPTKDG